jgi:hypothetical protein
MNIVARVQNILLRPQSEWLIIDSERTDPKTLYTSYICILALVPAAATLISTAFVASFFGGRIGMGVVLGAAIMQYLLTLLMVFVVAFIADALAPGFDGRKDLNQALKLTAYAMTAAWVAGIFAIIPLLGWLLAVAGAFYSLYLFYLGAPVLMKVPQEKTIAYTVVVVLVAIIIGWIIGMVNAAILGAGAIATIGGVR